MDVEVDGILVAAHELKGPLAVLRQLALSLGELTPVDEQLRGDMVNVSERALKQVDDLLKIKRLEEGMFRMEPVAVRAVCDDVTRELQYLFVHNRRDLRIKYANRAKLVTANRELLQSVIYNFLLNAMHYSGEGTPAELIVRESREKVKVTVRDYGPALPIDVWHAMRQGFIKKPVSIAMRPGSSGLGLYIASKFSRYMNASVGAVRHRDGTSFFVELPISKQASLFYDFCD